MSEEIGSVTGWLNLFKKGDRNVLKHLWERYGPRLIRLARTRLRGKAPPSDADEHDVALDAFWSFCKAAEANQFAELNDRANLLQILCMLTVRKAQDRIRYARRIRRDCNRTQSINTGEDSSVEPGPTILAALANREPDPAFETDIQEQLRLLLDELPDDVHRQIALWKLELWTNQEIAGKLGVSLSTVERKWSVIRRTGDEQNTETLYPD